MFLTPIPPFGRSLGLAGALPGLALIPLGPG